MYCVDDIEVAWVTQYRRLTRIIAWAAALLFAAYGLVDWLALPDASARAWQWRLVGTATCLLGVYVVDRQRWSRWIPAYIASSGVIVTVLVSVIYVAVMHHPFLALAAQMQVIAALAMVAVLRSVVRATLGAMLVSLNLLLGLQAATWQHLVLANCMVGGAALLVLFVSERSYCSFASRRELEARLVREATIVQSSGDAIFSLAGDGAVTSWNAGAEAVFGYSAGAMAGRNIRALLAPQSQAEHVQAIERIAQGGGAGQVDVVLARCDGSPVHVAVAVSPLRDAAGHVAGCSLIARDITARVQAERALRDQESQFHVAIETTTDGFWAADTRGYLVEVNEAYARLSGYTRQELLGLGIARVDADHGEADVAARLAQLRGSGNLRFETRHRRKDGSVWPVEVVASYSPAGEGRYFVFLKDLTQQRSAQELIWHQANFDRLTDLPNRALLYDRLSHACALARRSGRLVALLFADLDGFKQVNDRHGHEAGDRVLVQVAVRWLAAVRDTDTVARLGGDEFAIVLGDLIDAEDGTAVAQKLIDSLVPPIALGRQKHCQVGASIGIAIFPANGTQIDSLYRAADSAMYESKGRGKNIWTCSQAPTVHVDAALDWMVFQASDCVGVGRIDEQHRGLVAVVNGLSRTLATGHGEPEVKELLDQLVRAAVVHFDCEHALMVEYAYPDLERHDREHARLLGEVGAILARVSQGTDLLVLQTVKDWLGGHMHGMDRQLGEYLVLRGAQ